MIENFDIYSAAHRAILVSSRGTCDCCGISLFKSVSTCVGAVVNTGNSASIGKSYCSACGFISAQDIGGTMPGEDAVEMDPRWLQLLREVEALYEKCSAKRPPGPDSWLLDANCIEDGETLYLSKDLPSICQPELQPAKYQIRVETKSGGRTPYIWQYNDERLPLYHVTMSVFLSAFETENGYRPDSWALDPYLYWVNEAGLSLRGMIDQLTCFGPRNPLL